MQKQILDACWYLNVLNTGSTPKKATELPKNIPIHIPGDIASALINNGHIPDPFYGRNELDCLWIGETDWILSTVFDSTDDSSSMIVFESIDTVAEIRLNKQTIGYCKNMFRRYSIDTSGIVQLKNNLLEVIISSPVQYCKKEAEKLPYPVPQHMQLPWQWKDRNLLRKVACHGGWDWGITLMTGGIYEAPLFLHNFKGRISSVHTAQHREADSADWQLEVTVEYESLADGSIDLHLGISDISFDGTFSVTEGQNILQHTLIIHDPELWWPAGYGHPSLYNLTVRTPEEEISKKIGFRQVVVKVEDDDVGRSMSFFINGQAVFAKGANWIPADALPARQTFDVYHRLLRDAVEANMNMVRLWGGGQYEKDCFYEICNELGLMVWHDMMFACSLYPSDEQFLAEVDEEISYQIKRLKDHPSIVLWCGNNEDLGALKWFPESRENRDRYVVDYDRLNEGVVGKAIRQIDPDRTWWPSSPSAGSGDYSDCWHDDTKGDMHYWSVWHGNLPFESYYNITPRFCSEFGFQSFPSMKTVRSFSPDSQWNITSPVMRHHQKNNAGNSIILSTMARYFRMPKDFESYLYLSQVQQAYAIRTAVEYWRAQRPTCMGALYWQLNDNWPVASWSSIEYNGNWKLLHHEAKRFFSPTWLSMYIKDDVIYAIGINDSATAVSGNLIIKLLDFQGEIIDFFTIENALCPGSSVKEFLSRPLSEFRSEHSRDIPISYTLPKGEEADLFGEGYDDRFVHAEWIIENGTKKTKRIQTTLFLCKPRDCELADADITITKGESDSTIILEAEAPVFHVELETDIPGRFDDAGFFLMPGEQKKVQFTAADENRNLPEDFLTNIRVRHLKSSY